MGKKRRLNSLFNKYSRRNALPDILSKGCSGGSVFNISSKLNSTCTNSAEDNKTQTSSSAATLIPREGRNTSSSEGSTQPEMDSEPKEKTEEKVPQDTLDPLAAQTPSPEAEYDKLLDVETFPMPDGQVCLLALPPECCEGKGPEATPYLKLFCSYITDRKGVVSGILLVTSNKIFFDPSKTHPLVMEHGCEDYLLSYSIDNVASISFFSDISHVHFNTSQQRRKRNKLIQKLKAAKNRGANFLNNKGESCPPLVSTASSNLPNLDKSTEPKEVSEDEETESRDMAEAERELDSSPIDGGLGVSVLSSAATFCCGGQEEANVVRTDTDEAGKFCVKSRSPVPQRSSVNSLQGLRFVRLQVQPSSGKKKGVGGLQLGSAKTLPRRDPWLILSKESSDELHGYLKRCRPDLCILEGDEEGGDREEEEFVLVDGGEEGDEELFERHQSSGDDWEMVLMEDSRDKPTSVIDREPEGLANILENSRILEASFVRELCKELPLRTISHVWQLVYSTSRHGSSLKALYRKLSNTEAPILLIIKDALNEIFGAFLSHPLKPSENFYGTGETFLFMLHPRFKCFKWTGENSFFIKGDLDCFAIGGGSGHFGLWVDENLYLGRSSPCYTFNNCCLSETDDFRIMDLEVWTFG
ncbi:nuclear receptor coactivator 7 isoform 2-T2 [Pholidichthys leucotaenia]